MEPFHTLLDDLQLTKTNSIIKVRCIHVYEVAAPKDGTNIVSLECVLHDRMGIRIQATIPRILHARFGALIREGGIFRNFLVRQNRPRNPVTNHAYHIKMISSTQMFEVSEPQFPKMSDVNILITRYGRFQALRACQLGDGSCNLAREALESRVSICYASAMMSSILCIFILLFSIHVYSLLFIETSKLYKESSIELISVAI